MPILKYELEPIVDRLGLRAKRAELGAQRRDALKKIIGGI
jgi:hypothetical protein